MINRPLLTRQNAKTPKGEKQGYLTLILYLAPASTSGRNVCSNSTKGCRDSCLFTAGRGAYSNVREARLRKTREFYADKSAFIARLAREISKAEKLAARKGMKLAIRLNGTSDIPWENVKFSIGSGGISAIPRNLFEMFPSVQFYDYTKSFNRMVSFIAGDLPANYHLTFSRSETNDAECQTVLKHGGNVAIVVDKLSTLTSLDSYATMVVDGDEDDLRFKNLPGSLIKLFAKGKAKKDTTGFVFRSLAMS